jgi:hypothetical protein
VEGVREAPSPRGTDRRTDRAPRPSLLPPLNFPERGPRQAPAARREAHRGAGTYCSKRRRAGATRPKAEPAPTVPPGICDGRVTNGQQSTDPNSAGDHGGHQNLLAPTVGVPEGPLNIRTGGNIKPRRGRSTESRSAAREGRDVQTGMENKSPTPCRSSECRGGRPEGTPEGERGLLQAPDDPGGPAGGGAPKPREHQPTRTRSRENPDQLLDVISKCRPSTSLIYPPTYSGQNVG